MDLSGHGAFRPQGQARSAAQSGSALLTAAWVALASGRIERVALQLRHGPTVDGVTAIRVDGAVAELCTGFGQWTDLVLVDDIVRVTMVPRGGGGR